MPNSVPNVSSSVRCNISLFDSVSFSKNDTEWYFPDGDTFESNFKVQETREQSYGKIGDQLDLLYKDMLADKGDKTGEWFKAIKKVKDDNPK